MAEAIVISIFLLVLIVLQIKENKKIVVFAQVSWIKRILAVLLAIILLIIFWQPDRPSQIKLIVFASLILFFGFNKEGLASDHLVKFGLLTGKYREYLYIQIEEVGQGKSFVSFYKKKNTRFSLLFLLPASELVDYFNQLNLSSLVVLGELPGEPIPFKKQRKRIKSI